jgi:hypothetical protein
MIDAKLFRQNNAILSRNETNGGLANVKISESLN